MREDDATMTDTSSPESSRKASLAKQPMRAVWLAVGFSSVALAALGVALPLLPTTPFLILAAFAFAESSQRWHDWLHGHQVFGPIIADWNRYGAIRPRAKFIGVASMLAAFGLSLALGLNVTLLIIQGVALSGSAVFVLTRPSPPDAEDNKVR